MRSYELTLKLSVVGTSPPSGMSRCPSDQNVTLSAERRIRMLDSQISDLQSEASRLLRSLDLQKEESRRQSSSAQKEQEDFAKTGAAWKSELDSLRARVKQYSDYDEIKRELEIMKVHPNPHPSSDEGCQLNLRSSTSNFPVLKMTMPTAPLLSSPRTMRTKIRQE